MAGPLCTQVRDGGEGVLEVTTLNPKGSYASSKDSGGRHRRPYTCGVVFQHFPSSTAAPGGRGCVCMCTARQALVGAPCLRHLQLGPKVWPGRCTDCPELTDSHPGRGR